MTDAQPPVGSGPSRQTNGGAVVIVIAAMSAMIVGISIGALAVWLIVSASSPAGRPVVVPAETVWTCSMHPQIRKPAPGDCPICGMDLIPAGGASAGGGERTFVTTTRAAALMDVQAMPVERKFVTAEVRMVGKINYDETRLAHITAWVPGRLERLFVDYTGVAVRKGDHMVEIYSPDLLAAQEELIQAKRAIAELRGSDVGIVRQTTEATLTASREKLRLLGLTDAQVKAIEGTGKAADRVTIFSPAGGIVIHKTGQEGMYVKTGSRIYTIADLSTVWVQLDAYESDLSWLKYGQRVSFTTEAYPGKAFTGTISFIDPVLTDRTRTVKVRVNAPNAAGVLKPGMFVRAKVQARVAVGGRVMSPELAGKWICPMHPSVIKVAAGTCDICEMPLVRTESLGYVSPDSGPEAAPLVVPASAVLKTGTRAVVYVRTPGDGPPAFEGRTIELGPRAGDYYLVEKGLAEGERVVTRGNFKIDSALQIQAKPSMMSPKAPAATQPAPNRGLETTLSQPLLECYAATLSGYLTMQESLASDDAASALKGTRRMQAALDLSLKGSGEGENPAWKPWAEATLPLVDDALKTNGLEPLRKAFAPISEQMIAGLPQFNTPDKPVYQVRCPMAFNNRGGRWLQKSPGVRNPYFGAAMLQCGSVEQTFGPAEESHE